MAQTCGEENAEDDGGGTADTCSVISARGSHGSGRYPCSPNEERRAGCRVPSPLLPPRSRVRAVLGSRSCIEPGSLQRRLGTASAASVQRCAVGPEGEEAASFRRAAHTGIICIAVRCSLCPSPPTSPGRCSKSECQLEKKRKTRSLAEGGVMFCHDK